MVPYCIVEIRNERLGIRKESHC